MIKLNSNKDKEIISDYITALNSDAESIKQTNDKHKAEYDTYDDDELKVSADTYDDEHKVSADKSFDCI